MGDDVMELTRDPRALLDDRFASLGVALELERRGVSEQLVHALAPIPNDSAGDERAAQSIVKYAKSLKPGGCLGSSAARGMVPRLNAVLHEGQSFSQLDTEAAIGLPAIVAATFALFGLLGRWGLARAMLRTTARRESRSSVALSRSGKSSRSPSAHRSSLGGFAVTLGVEGMRRAEFEGKRGRSLAATALGVVASLVLGRQGRLILSNVQ